VAEPLKAYAAEPYSYAEARALSESLGVSEPVAITLVRRGYRTPEDARRFLDADESHPPSAFDSIGTITERLRAAIGERRRITVHGDFDVDGVCATTIAVSALRELGAECDWLIPDRLSDGYGLSEAGVDVLAERGTSLILTVDCGITAVEAVEHAKARGIEVVVSDHHQPGPDLPDCPILHPSLSGYPFTELCGTAVAWKLTQALREAAGQDPPCAEEDLDLVALATVADIVPLLGENRSLVRRGLAVARRARRPGLRALMAASHIEPSTLDEGDLAFRLGPRINAAGRLYRADAGVELFLTDDGQRAEAIAGELDRANQERRQIEREVDGATAAALRELPERLRDAKAIVLAGEGWHPGVIGIVASRLVERHFKPVVLISLDGEGSGRGSGRSIPGFDLLEGLRACSEHLERFGGHRAAAGLELRAESLDPFREAFVAHAAEAIGPGDRARTERIDAVVGGDGIGLDLAEELVRLGPFGAGNPGVSLLVPSARVRDVRGMGEGKHSRFSLHSGVHRALTVAFGRPSIAVGEDEPVDAAVRLEVNQWNGAVEPRLVLREMYRLGEDGDPVGATAGHVCEVDAGEWWERFDAEMASELDATPPSPTAGDASEREIVRRSGSVAAIIAELVSSGGRVLALSSDASRRAGLAAGAAGLARFGAGAPRIACGRCPRKVIEPLADPLPPGLVLSDYAALELAPEIAAAHDHVVLVDPPPFPRLMALARSSDESGRFLHPVWGEAEHAFALSVLEEQYGLRMSLRSLFRDLRAAAPAHEDSLQLALRGGVGRHHRSPQLAARCMRVLAELGLARIDLESGARRLGAVSSDGTELKRSATFRAYSARHEKGKRYLESLRHR
jgi:single-stranded-DNA-specific exonuclease